MSDQPTTAADPERRIHEAAQFLDMVPGWPAGDWQGLKYHAMAHAAELHSLAAQLTAQQAEIARLQDEVGRLESLAEDVVDTHARVVEIEQARLEAREAAIARVVAEMRSLAAVAGQCSVEGPEHTTATLMAAAEAERLAKWVDQLAPASPQEPTR